MRVGKVAPAVRKRAGCTCTGTELLRVAPQHELRTTTVFAQARNEWLGKSLRRPSR